MATENEFLDLLESKPLITFQMEAMHLHNILQFLARNQRQQDQVIAGNNRRLQVIEATLQEVLGRVKQFETLVRDPDELPALRQHLGDVTTAVDGLQRQLIPDLRRQMEDQRRVTQGLDRNVQGLTQVIGPMQQELQKAMEDLSRDVSQTHRHMQNQVQQLAVAHDEHERDRSLNAQRVVDQHRELVARTERLEREGVASRLKELDELNARTNENFRQVEITARQVDVELQKLRADVGNVRAELNTLDNTTRNRLAKISEDLDGKFEMLLGVLQNYEKNSSALEETLTQAGRALAERRAGFASVPHHFNPTPVQTTTTTTIRGGQVSHDVRRNFTPELSGARGSSTGPR